MRPIVDLVTTKSRLIAIMLAAAICVLGLIYTCLLEETVRFSDESTYVTLASNLAVAGIYSMDGETPVAFRPPGYAALLSVIAMLGGGVAAFRLVNYIALSISLWLVYLIARKESGPVAGAAAAAAVFSYPVFFFAAGTMFPQTVTSTLLLTVVWLLFRQDSLGIKSALLIGALFGVVILITPTVVFTLIFTLAWVFAARCRRCFRNALVILLIAFVIIGGWSVRNYRVLNSCVFVSTNGGLNLLLGNSEHTTANNGSTADISAYREHTRDMTEAERDRYFARKAIVFARNNPARWTKLYLLKFLNYFNYRNTLATRNESGRAREIVVLLSYGLLLLLAAGGLVMMGRWPLGKYEKFAYLLYVMNGLFSALFFTRIRFRIPFDFLLVTVSAIFLARCLGEGRGKVASDQPPSDA